MQVLKQGKRGRGALVLVHGRGADARSILQLHGELGLEGLEGVAPQAPGHSWYPYSFLAPLEQNQPYLDRALGSLDAVVADLGLPAERIGLLGFSQGACLVSEFAARRGGRWGAVLALTGGLIGPPGIPRNYPGSLQDTPVLLASGDPDAHVPWSRVQESADVFTRMGARVDLRRYPGLPHTINADELDACRRMIEEYL